MDWVPTEKMEVKVVNSCCFRGFEESYRQHSVGSIWLNLYGGRSPDDAYKISQNLCELFFIQVHQ